jgi:hypothetical protein
MTRWIAALLIAGLAAAACGKYGPPVRSRAEAPVAGAAETTPDAAPAPLAPASSDEPAAPAAGGGAETPQAPSEESQS